MDALVGAAGAAPWIEPPLNCGAGGQLSPSFETSYALEYQGAPLGLVALHWAHGDSNFANGLFGTCAMNEVGTSVTMLVEPARRILLGPIMLPGVGKLGSIVLSRPAGGTAVRAVAYKDDGELELSIREATRCD
jgi:hypothetical protein